MKYLGVYFQQRIKLKIKTENLKNKLNIISYKLHYVKKYYQSNQYT